MASPWKFLARLISPGREQKRENFSATEAKPDASPTASLADVAASESANGADRPASDATHPRTGAVSPQLVHCANAENDVFDKVGREGTRNEGAAGPALSAGLDIDVTAARGVTDLRRAVEVAPRQRQRRGKKVGAISHVSHADEMSLDEEIRVLRGQLAGKLKLQNEQLRKMLERFER